MTSWITVFYYSLISASILLSLIGLWFTAIVPGIDRWSKRFFLSYFIIYLLCCLSSLVESFLTIHAFSIPAIYFILFLESLLLSLPLPMLTAYLLHCTGENIRSGRLFRAAFGLWIIFIGAMVVTWLMGSAVTVMPDGQYTRGSMYSYVLLPGIAIAPLNLAGLIRRRAQLSRKIYLGFLIAILPMTVALIMQLFIDVFALLDISLVLSALSMYSFVLSDQIERDRRYQMEIANQRASIMVLQMRPHFIYNTMTSIYCLCDQDPQLARQVIMDFTTYLRKNFTAVASPTLIPFSSELEHTRAYLAVEQALYEDSLFVDYDTPHTWFRVPPLTLQPIVENAIKHGRDPYAGPFRISIRTRKTNSGNEICIEDNGRGFAAIDDNEPHIAINNIRQRLEIMCGGRLTITSSNGGGTVVTLTIPDSP